jgi:UDP-N-acetylmuramate--L-alanine ligase/UDP-N-acetylenolpyruvoylglucosamine reductase
MGLGPLAIYAAELGFQISGSDDQPNEAMCLWLERAGITLTAPDTLPPATELVVISSAIPAAHPALVAARNRGLPIVRRGEFLAELARTRRLVAVCGSHGKTTTTAMLVTVLRAAGLAPGYVGGGLFADTATPPASAGTSDLLIAEIDESDGTIGRFAPHLTVLVNLDWDHPDHYRTSADLEATFAALLARTSGPVLINAACPLSARAATALTNVSTFGLPPAAYTLAAHQPSGPTRLGLTLGGLFPATLSNTPVLVRAFGDFNAFNATAAFAAAHLLGATIPPDALAAYSGVRRRQAALAVGAAFTVIEDYAHHPAEIAALLGGLRLRLPGSGRLRVVFQPHRHSRTAQFRTAFASALSAADALYLLDVYSAGESPVPGGDTTDLATAVRAAAPSLALTHLSGEHAQVFTRLSTDLQPGDLVAIVGAGDLDVSARAWLASFDYATWWDKVSAALTPRLSADTKLTREVSLADKTTLRVGGAARLYAEPAHDADLVALVRAAHALGLRLLPLGRGSNLLVPDSGVDALVVSLRHPFWESFTPLPPAPDGATGRIHVRAGLRLKNLCGLAAKSGLAGYEFLEGIPGNIGGALRMNAGAMGGWMFDVVESVELVTLAGERLTLPKSAMHVDYRHCAELDNAIALAATLRAPSSDTRAAAEINQQIDAYRDKRRKTQPREPSAGCIFKNPPGDSAGRLIDASGLKGTRQGDAEVSPTHANFIVNHDHARAADVIALVRRVRAEVEKAQGIRLEPEVLLYGSDWKDVL